MTKYASHIKKPVINIVRKDVAKLPNNISVKEALDYIREKGLGERIIYFYVVDKDDCLIGVLPTRRLLTAPTEQQISELMISRVIAVPQQATLLETYGYFLQHKLLAFPVVDEQRRLLGVVDITMFADDSFDASDQESLDRAFEMIGFRLMQVRVNASPLHAFRFRFPWLFATIASGTVCALLAGLYVLILSKSLIMAFLLTLALTDISTVLINFSLARVLL